MPTAARLIALSTLLACVTSPPSQAQTITQGQASVSGQSVTFEPAVGLWDPEQNTASLLYVTKALSAADEAQARRDGSWPLDGVGPAIKVSLSFVPGKFSAAMNELDRCWVGINGFKGQPIEISGNAPDCHLISTGGRLQPGGMLMGLLEGKGNGYSYRLPFSVMFPAGAGPTTAAAAPAPPAATPPARPAAPAGPPISPNSAAGTGTYMGQTLRFTHGLAWRTGDKIEIALFDHAPRANILAELRTGTWGDGGPAGVMTLMADTTKQGPPAVTYCFVSLDSPKGGPMGINVNDARSCGLTELSGTLTAGGSVAARLAGSAPMRDKQPMAWDLRFNLPIAK